MMNKQVILIVDDDSAHLALVERYVALTGFQTRTATNVATAVECLKSDDVFLVITDMVMPEMDGMELLHYTKEHYGNIDVIIMTGYSSKYSYVDVIKAGATDFIEKPFVKDELLAKLDRVFRERNLLKELVELKDKAEAGSRAKTNFLCTIGHELKTPMNGIIGFAGLLSKADLPLNAMKYVMMVSQSADRLMRLINQILDFSTIEAGRMDIKPSHFQLDTVFNDLLGIVQPKSVEKGLSLSLDIDDSLSNAVLFGDQLALSQILYNLTDNAIKFTDSGAIEILVEKIKDLPDHAIELKFTVKDTGCGVDPEKREGIFEPFAQADEYMTRRHEGAGLGLAICARLVTMMDGVIWLESQIDKGSRFFFTVKMASA